MNDNAKQWVAALRSGKYKQGKGTLRYNGAHCCLGVACELAVEAGELDDHAITDATVLPCPVMKWLGLKSQTGAYGTLQSDILPQQTLANDNDMGMTFAQIADIIESEPERLFKK